MTLVDLEKAHYATPDLYRKLAVLTGKIRRKYQQGMQRSEGLTLLRSLPVDSHDGGAREAKNDGEVVAKDGSPAVKGEQEVVDTESDEGVQEDEVVDYVEEHEPPIEEVVDR